MANVKQIKFYTVDHDFGINPNPFFGYCSMGHCKAMIRRVVAKDVLKKNANGKAEDLGFWIVGVASGRNKDFKGDCGGKVVYAMQVTEVLSYEEYWNDCRFADKKGDEWSDFAFNPENKDFRNCNDNIKSEFSSDCSEKRHCSGKSVKKKDEGEQYVLISDNFIYWGEKSKIELGKDVYDNDTGGARYYLSYPKGKRKKEMEAVVEFINKKFGNAKHQEVLGKPIMSSPDFNLKEAKEASKRTKYTGD